jgi:hypothetical protein
MTPPTNKTLLPDSSPTPDSRACQLVQALCGARVVPVINLKSQGARFFFCISFVNMMTSEVSRFEVSRARAEAKFQVISL